MYSSSWSPLLRLTRAEAPRRTERDETAAVTRSNDRGHAELLFGISQISPRMPIRLSNPIGVDTASMTDGRQRSDNPAFSV
jgi:hypothetical protein